MNHPKYKFHMRIVFSMIFVPIGIVIVLIIHKNSVGTMDRVYHFLSLVFAFIKNGETENEIINDIHAS